MRAWTIALALIGGSSALGPDGPSTDAQPSTITIRGVVRPLADALAEAGVAVDAEGVAKQVVVIVPGRTAVPLLLNSASRALFTDPRLRGRETELVGRSVNGFPHLDVVLFRVRDEDGAFRIAEYYCDVCAIAVRYDQICPCCQGELELRYGSEN